MKYLRKKRNRFIFLTCGYVSIVNRKFHEFFEKIFIKCAYISDQTSEIEKITYKEEIKEKINVGEKVIEHKEEIIEHYQSLYNNIKECEEDNDFLARSLIKSYVLFKEKRYDELDAFFKEIDMEYYVNP